MSTELQISLKQMWRSGYYEECLAEAAKAKVGDTPLTEIESREDLLAFIGHMMKAQAQEREGNRIAFQQRRIEEDGDSGRVDWMEADLRRLLSIFQFIRVERLTVREAIDWLAGNPADEKLPAEFLAAFEEASKVKSPTVVS
jgi:hypothetical protein